MSIKWTFTCGLLEIVCTLCNSRSEYGGHTYNGALRQAYNDGWQPFRSLAGQCCYRCPECAKEEAKKENGQ